jgi:hypothetical protein
MVCTRKNLGGKRKRIVGQVEIGKSLQVRDLLRHICDAVLAQIELA